MRRSCALRARPRPRRLLVCVRAKQSVRVRVCGREGERRVRNTMFTDLYRRLRPVRTHSYSAQSDAKLSFFLTHTTSNLSCVRTPRRGVGRGEGVRLALQSRAMMRKLLDKRILDTGRLTAPPMGTPDYYGSNAQHRKKAGCGRATRACLPACDLTHTVVPPLSRLCSLRQRPSTAHGTRGLFSPSYLARAGEGGGTRARAQHSGRAARGVASRLHVTGCS